MSESDKIANVFSCFHEGTIAGFIGEHKLLTLQIDCGYLAKKINRSFESFFIELSNVSQIELVPWSSPGDQPVRKIADLAKIFESGLEVVSAEIADGIVVIACMQLVRESIGVNLFIEAESVRVLDQKKDEISIGDLQKWSRSYWEEIEDDEYNKRDSDF
jgi:hypothetical protein